MDEIKAAIRRKNPAMGGGGCLKLEMKRQSKDIWKLTEKKREGLKGIYNRVKRK